MVEPIANDPPDYEGPQFLCLMCGKPIEFPFDSAQLVPFAHHVDCTIPDLMLDEDAQ